jgi:hypothetical protein
VRNFGGELADALSCLMRNSFSRNRTGFEKVMSECVLHLGLNMWRQKKKLCPIILIALIAHHTPNLTSCSHFVD